MNETDEDHYDTPRLLAKPRTPSGSPVPAVRKKKIAVLVEESAQKTSPLSASSSFVWPSPVQAPVPATSVTSRAVQGTLEFYPQPAAVSEDNFGSCLQSGRDCINKRHDDELKALESFRAYIHKRAKADAEYAVTLGKIGSQAARDTGCLATGSKIVQAWNAVIEAMDTIQKRVQSVSKQVEDTILRITDQLIKEKRAIKRAYDNTRSQLDTEYSDSCNQVLSLKKEYHQMLQVTEGAKNKMDKSMQKSNVKQAENDKLHAKYISSAERLHKCHNDYTLAILNANTHLEHYRKSTVPFCLSTLQERMELIVSQWKGSMEEYVRNMDMSEVYQESFGKLSTVLKKLNPKDEYTSLIKDNKSIEDTEEETFAFDASLLQGYCSPKVKATKMSVNNLTYESLRTELSKMEQRLEEYENGRLEKEKRFKVLEDGNGPVSEEPKAVIRANLQTELKQMDCSIDREKVKIARVKEDLNAMGKALPVFDSVCNDVSSTRQPHLSFTETSDTNATGNVNKETKNDAPIYQLGTSLTMSGGSDEEKDEDLEGYEIFQSGDAHLGDEGWFYADMERKVAEMKCKNPGDYLVRYSSKQNRYVLTMNWAGQGKNFVIQEIRDEKNQMKYGLESKSFPSIQELLQFHVTTQTAVSKSSGAILMQPVLKKWMLHNDNILIGKRLGKGAFGDVFDAEFKGQKVVVKTCRSIDIREREKFLQEVEILKLYDHPNVVKLIGVSWDTESVLVAMELMPGGSLLDYLRKKAAQMTKGKLLHMSIDACSGMEYLESRGCIHRDLGARSCLVGENIIVKISDFGMTHVDIVKSLRQFYIKWTAPEALSHGMYTSASDVWSFGILLWEVFSGGALPYAGMSNTDTKDRVNSGYRMPPPPGCPNEIHLVMQQCWMQEPEERPNFTGVLGMLKALERTVL